MYFKGAKPKVVGSKDPISNGLNSKTVELSATIISPGERSSATMMGIGALPEEKSLSFWIDENVEVHKSFAVISRTYKH